MKFLIMKRGLQFVFFILLLNVSVAFSQPATLDASFGYNGFSTIGFSNTNTYLSACALQNNGKIITAGKTDSIYTITRFTSNGIIDSSFGLNGKVFYWPGTNNIGTCSIAVQADNKIVLGGSVTFQNFNIKFLLLRLNTNGKVDSTFGNNGVVITTPVGSTFSRIEKILIKPNGKIVVGGYAVNPSIQILTFSVAQYNTNGSIDSTFGNNGFANLIEATGHGHTMEFSNQIDILIGGDVDITGGSGYVNFGLMKVLNNGKVDSTFGKNGFVNADFADSIDGCTSIAVQNDNKIVLAGSVQIGAHYRNIGLIRYDATGKIDSSFGINGKVIFQSDSLGGTVIHILSNGKILLTLSKISTGNSVNFAMIELNANGTLNTSFGNNGILITPIPGSNGYANASIIQPDGKVIIAGGGMINSLSNFILARYNSVTLPLHLLTFTAHKQGITNLLQWQTAQEINVDHFIVERSLNGREFNKIGEVKAGLSNYSFSDNNLLKATNYYRLKMVDKDGVFTYSPIRSINNSGTFSVSIYPNPAKDNLQLQIESDKPTTLELQIISQDGKVLLSHNTTATAGSILRSINISALAKGSYFLKATSTENHENNVKFEKL